MTGPADLRQLAQDAAILPVDTYMRAAGTSITLDVARTSSRPASSMIATFDEADRVAETNHLGLAHERTTALDLRTGRHRTGGVSTHRSRSRASTRSPAQNTPDAI